MGLEPVSRKARVMKSIVKTRTQLTQRKTEKTHVPVSLSRVHVN